MEEINLQRVMQSVYDIFAKFDKDNSESLELAEMMNLLQACRIDVSRRECEVIMEQMDANHDGVLDFAEFMTFLGMIFKIRFSKQMKIKEEFQMKLQRQATKNNDIKRMERRASKPPPPPRKGSVLQPSTRKNIHSLCS